MRQWFGVELDVCICAGHACEGAGFHYSVRAKRHIIIFAGRVSVGYECHMYHEIAGNIRVTRKALDQCRENNFMERLSYSSIKIHTIT